MSVKSSLLITLGTLTLGAGAFIQSASAADIDFYNRCEYIRNLTDVHELQQLVRQNDACSVVALERIVDITQPAQPPVQVSYNPPPPPLDMS
jgi:hypothetical protein